MLVRLILSFSLSASLLYSATLWGQNADPRLGPVDVSIRDYIVDIPPVDGSAKASIEDIPPQSLHSVSKKSVASTWGPRSIPAAATQAQGASTFGPGPQPKSSTRTEAADQAPNAPATGNVPRVTRNLASNSISGLSLGKSQVRKTVRPAIDPQTNPENPRGAEETAKKLHRWNPRSAQQRAGLSKSVGNYHRQSARSEPCRTQAVSTKATCSATSSKTPISAADRLRQSASATNNR